MKIARHSKIIELVDHYDIETQEELASRLNEAGFRVTQATVSRDIRELNLTKVAKPGGGYKYTVKGWIRNVGAFACEESGADPGGPGGFRARA